MFTGIIRDTGIVNRISAGTNGKRFSIQAPSSVLSQLEEGITSVAINGSCHTVEVVQGNAFTAFSSFETLKRTTMGDLKRGACVNLELPLTPVTLLDGHIVQGHVDDVGKVVSVTKNGEAYLYRFSAEKSIIEYLVEKDSVAIDGISLTIFHIGEGGFEVAVIPETIEKTSLKNKSAGSRVNLEVNIFAKYARKFSGDRQAEKLNKIEDWLKQG